MASPAAGCEPLRRFRYAAAHYLAGRPPYAGLLIRRVADLAGLTCHHRMLDLGCGPGVLARAFAPLAGAVVAMDPEPEMLAAADEYCAGVGNIRVVAGSSNDLAPTLGRFRLVVMGRAFHWMDRADTLCRLDALIEPGGAVVHFHTHHADVPANAWTERLRDLRRCYADDRHDGPQEHGKRWVRHEVFMLASPFRCIEAHSVFEERAFDADTLVDRVFSMSSMSRARVDGRAEALERDLRALIREIAPDGRLTEVIESNALIGRRPDGRGE
ncbi:MAG TPA: class I SAM-dependent methyltransferase [Acetobacteraceae bacterium]|jgi:SAM-dependent methyltransferase|nr:class I SAM-dependent methyltransferase [Acetobacteraceae bacterium]